MTQEAWWRVSWGNPSTEPPHGLRELMRVRVPWGPHDPKGPPPTVLELWRTHPGYAMGWDAVPQPHTRWSAERKRQARAAKIRREVPLFAEECIQRELGDAPAPPEPEGKDTATQDLRDLPASHDSLGKTP